MTQLGQTLLRLDGEPAPDAKLRDRVTLEVANLGEATAVIVKYHYLHRGRTMTQLPYWINLDDTRVGVLLFSYPRMSAHFQGHAPMNLLELARMWLDPAVQGMRITDSRGQEHSFSVATCAVGMALRRVRQDWHQKYPNLPRVEAIVSWADQVHHEGTIYRASNFKEVGVSGGSLHGRAKRATGGRDQANPDYLHLKTAFIFEFGKPLRGDFPIGPASRERVLSHKLPEVNGRGLLDADPVLSDV